jgi:hypothetical protein
MAHSDEDVKTRSDNWRERCLDFIDCHPRVGWYIAGISTLNVILEILQLVHH